ncbi:MAG: hypothetical protein IIB17_02305 [Chloroflexi bacterium]|nr:hypothetical protein [Chloroflexota bacterium]
MHRTAVHSYTSIALVVWHAHEDFAGACASGTIAGGVGDVIDSAIAFTTAFCTYLGGIRPNS